MKRDDVVGSALSEVLALPSTGSSRFAPPAPLDFSQEHAEAIASGREFTIAGARLQKSSSSSWSPLSFSNNSVDGGSGGSFSGGSGYRAPRNFSLRFRYGAACIMYNGAGCENGGRYLTVALTALGKA